jgi:hypothetical protein
VEAGNGADLRTGAAERVDTLERPEDDQPHPFSTGRSLQLVVFCSSAFRPASKLRSAAPTAAATVTSKIWSSE